MYCIEFAVIGGLTVALEDFFKTASVPVSVLIIAAVIVALTSLTYVLDKKNIIVKLVTKSLDKRPKTSII